MKSRLLSSAFTGVFWSAIERFSLQVVQFVLSIIISREVAPREYGLIAMIGVFLSIAQTFIDSGFVTALIQKVEPSDKDFSTVFFFNLFVSIAIYHILFFSGKYIAVFYEEPRLQIMVKYLGINLVLSSLAIVQRTKLTIKMDFRTQAKCSLLSVVIGGLLGVYFAFQNYGAIALIIQILTTTALNTLLLWLHSSWIPKLVFCIESFRSLFAFGSKLFFSSLLHNIYLNFYSLVIGKFYAAEYVGYYNRAYSLSQYPSVNLVDVISRAMYPFLCNLKDDLDELRLFFLKYLRLLCFIIFPLMTILSILSKSIVIVVLTEKWLGAYPLLQVLCVAFMFYPIQIANNEILSASGRSDLFLKAEIFKKVTAVGIIIVTIPLGVYALCWGLLFYNIFDVVIAVFFSKKVIQIGFFTQLKGLSDIFLVTLLTSVVTMLVLRVFDKELTRLIFGLCSSIFAYILFSRLLNVKELGIVFQRINQINK